MNAFSRALFAAAASQIAAVQAFPPAPPYTIYGIVRDQVGQKVTSAGATLIILNNGVEASRTPIASVLGVDWNYVMPIKVDQAHPGTILYNRSAFPTQGVYSLAVEMDGSFFYPIEIAGLLRVGKGGERLRLDLNLGLDSDQDGLPDIWEEWQLYQAGIYPNANGRWDISVITRDGDYDGDGVSNYLEYIAGTFAGDATETFALVIREKLADRVRFEFFAVTGKTYTIERSPDMKTWSPASFAVGSATIDSPVFTAPGVGILSATSPVDQSAAEFYRLSVR